MQKHLRKSQRLSLLLTPVVAASVLAASPTQAATLSFAQAELTITGLGGKFSLIDSLNEAETDAISKKEGSFVEVLNSPASTNVSNNPSDPTIDTFAVSEAYGKEKDYLGIGYTNSKVIGQIDVAQGEELTFNFEAFLDLETGIDNPQFEHAEAIGEVGFWLFDTTGLNKQDLDKFSDDIFAGSNTNLSERALEYFTLGGNLKTVGSGDTLESTKSANIFLSLQDQAVDFEDKDDRKEFATASFQGLLKRSFDKDSKLTLFATRKTQVRVAAPEPSTNLAFLISCGLAAIANNYQRKKTRFSCHNRI
jgi:hypothetical protein